MTALGVAPLPVMTAWTRSAVSPVAAPTGDPAVYRERIMRARRNAAWWALAGVLVFGVVASAHGPAAGVITSALLSLSPNVLAHASLATTDALFAGVTGLFIVMMIGYLRAPTPWWAAGVAVALGLALGTKYSALVLFAAALLLFAIRHRGRRWMVDLAIIAGALLVAWAAHGFATSPLLVPGGRVTALIEQLFGWTGQAARLSAWAASLEAPIYVRGIAAQLYLDSLGQKAFLLGETSQHGWWYYFPVALALKSTPVELAALATFVVFAIARRGRDAESAVLVAVSGLLMLAAMFSHRALGVRYVLPIVYIAVAGSVGWLAERWRPRARFAAGVAAAALAAQLVSFQSIAPHHLAYFNWLSGGPSAGHTKLVDSNADWGQDLPSLADALRERGSRRVLMAYFGTAPAAAYGVDAMRLRAAGVDVDRPEWFALSATFLHGVMSCGDPFRAFRDIAPDGRAGYSIFLYATRREEVAAALTTARQDPCLP